MRPPFGEPGTCCAEFWNLLTRDVQKRWKAVTDVYESFNSTV